MNTKIQKLLVDSGFHPTTLELMGVMPQVEKFAELIVSECAMICYHSWFMDSEAHANNLLSEFNIDNCRDEK